MNNIEIEYLNVLDLIPYVSNPKAHPESQIQQIMGSIKRFGFTQPILIQGDNTIIAGHGRLIAAKRLRMEKVPCIKLSHLSPLQARQLVIIDNKIAENGEWDLETLKLELKDLQLADVNIADLGFDSSELKNLLTELPPDKEGDSDQKGEIPFSECIGEANQYVVLAFRNEVDWLAACEHFQIKQASARRNNGSYMTTGTGRVIDGSEYLSRALKNVF